MMEWRVDRSVVLIWTLLVLVEINFAYTYHNDDAGKRIEKIENMLGQYAVQQAELLFSDGVSPLGEGRTTKKRKLKFLLPMILGAILVKSIILPIVLKGLAILSTKAVLLSVLSLVASLVGTKRSARHDDKTEVQVIHVPLKHGHHDFKRMDQNVDSYQYYGPYSGQVKNSIPYS